MFYVALNNVHMYTQNLAQEQLFYLRKVHNFVDLYIRYEWFLLIKRPIQFVDISLFLPQIEIFSRKRSPICLPAPSLALGQLISFFFSSHCRCFASWDNFATFAFYYYYYTLSYPQLFDQPIRAQNQSPKIDELYIHFPQDLVKKPLIASLTNPGPVIYNNHQTCCKLQKISHLKN